MNRPIVRISDKGAEFLKKGQMWMYSNNLDSDISLLENGCVADILMRDDTYLGTGYLSKDSHITVRIFSKKKEDIDQSFFEKKIQDAFSYRKTVEPNNLDNCRLISEKQMDYLD